MTKTDYKFIRRSSLLLLVFVLFLISTILSSYLSGTKTDLVKVKFLNIGQGDAILIETASGRQVLIDGGADKQVLQRLAEELKFGDKKIDIVIASHPDSDHIGGLPYVFQQYQIDAYLDSGVLTDGTAYQAIDNHINQNQTPHFYAVRGTQIILDTDVVLTVLSPATTLSNFDTNTQSIILRLDYGSSSVLFTGDAPQVIEEYLVKNNFNLSADILKVGHHGSKTSTADNFVQAVAPQYAAISVGKNSYGHPAPEVLETLQKNSVQILRTDELGTISCLLSKVQIVCH